MRLKMLESKLCETFQEKIKGLDKEVEEVHVDAHTANMRLNDQKKLIT